MCEIHVGDLVAATDVVHLSVRSFVDEQINCPAVIEHVQPVAYVASVTVQRHRNVVDRVGDEQRDQLFGKLIRPVVVRRPRDDDGYLVSGPIAVGEPVRARLARRIGITRFEFIGLATRARRHASVHLVSRNLDEARQSRRTARRLEQHERPFDVGLDEFTSGENRSIDMCFRREMDDDVRLLDERCADGRIADIAVHESMARIRHHVVEVLSPPRVGQLVECGDVPIGMGRQRVTNEVAADEAGATGNEDFNGSRH
jgi:hypothetical protein